MMKITAVFVLILGLCLSVQAQTRAPDHQSICRRQNARCLSRESRNGRTNDVTNIFNSHCLRTRGWRNVTRCELTRASCQLTLLGCNTLTCANVRRALATGGGPTTPRIPTPRTPSPDPDTDTTTRGGRTPRPRTPGPGPRTPRPRTTTRRTTRSRTTRSRTTTRRTTTRRGSRTTTRRGGRTTTVRPTAED